MGRGRARLAARPLLPRLPPSSPPALLASRPPRLPPTLPPWCAGLRSAAARRGGRAAHALRFASVTDERPSGALPQLRAGLRNARCAAAGQSHAVHTQCTRSAHAVRMRCACGAHAHAVQSMCMRCRCSVYAVRDAPLQARLHPPYPVPHALVQLSSAAISHKAPSSPRHLRASSHRSMEAAGTRSSPTTRRHCCCASSRRRAARTSASSTAIGCAISSGRSLSSRRSRRPGRPARRGRPPGRRPARSLWAVPRSS